MFIRKSLDKILAIIFIVLVSTFLGYALRMHHEGKIREINQSQAEKDLAALEEEFYSAMKNPRSFLIFNGMFEVYPAKRNYRLFYYRKSRDSSPDDIQMTKNTKDNITFKKETKPIMLSDDPSLNDLKE